MNILGKKEYSPDELALLRAHVFLEVIEQGITLNPTPFDKAVIALASSRMYTGSSAGMAPGSFPVNAFTVYVFLPLSDSTWSMTMPNEEKHEIEGWPTLAVNCMFDGSFEVIELRLHGGRSRKSFQAKNVGRALTHVLDTIRQFKVVKAL